MGLALFITFLLVVERQAAGETSSLRAKAAFTSDTKSIERCSQTTTRRVWQTFGQPAPVACSAPRSQTPLQPKNGPLSIALHFGHPLPRSIKNFVKITAAPPGGGGLRLARQEVHTIDFSSGIFSAKRLSKNLAAAFQTTRRMARRSSRSQAYSLMPGAFLREKTLPDGFIRVSSFAFRDTSSARFPV